MTAMWSIRHFLLLLIAVERAYTQMNTPVRRRCDVPADVVFLMDASQSIKDTEWEQMKDFVSVLIERLEVERYAIHVGVIVYSTEIGFVIDLQPFKSKPQLQDLLKNKATQINQGTDTAKAISKLIDMSYNQGRLDAKQIAVVITDGRSTNVSATIQEARRARTQYNIDLIVLGVGNETYPKEMAEIAGEGATSGPNQRLYEVTSFNQLLDVQAQMENIICEIVPPSTIPTSSTTSTTPTTPTTTTPYIPPLLECSNPADLVFLIDGSYSITPPDWVKGKQFVSYLINSLDIGLDSINVGIVVYSSAIGDSVPLKPFRGKSEMRQAASGLIQPPVGRTNTALGLETVRDMIRSQARPGVPHIAIVITDGLSSNPSMTRDQAALAKNEGIVIFVVGVGQRVIDEEKEDMASSLKTLFDAPDFSSLVGMVKLLRDNICSAIQETTTTSTTTTTTTMPTPAPIPPECLECLVEGGVGYNSNPNECTSFVMCVPLGRSYDPQVKQCPFGMFWSTDAVSCLDARYVNCPQDKCRRMSNGQTYSSASSGCRGYWRCSNSRSTPMCCQKGSAYVEGSGCVADSSCQESCPLDVTIDNMGACKYRVNPETPYGYLEVVPGQGHVKRSCGQGQVYDQKNCSCTYEASQFACSPFVKLAFGGKFVDSSPKSQPINAYKMGVTNRGHAYFNGEGYLSLPATANQEFNDKFMIHFKYRMRNVVGKKPWNANHGWGFQSWYQNSSRHSNTRTNIVVRTISDKLPRPPTPKGASDKVLEVIQISKNGTVIRDPKYDVTVDASWPGSRTVLVDSIQLGGVGRITTPTMKNGIVYTPIGNGRLLVQEPSISANQQKWRILSVDSTQGTGRVVLSGIGTVPQRVQTQYRFDLRPQLVERWFILEPAGVVLQEGSGSIPVEIRNRYAGFMAGTLVVLFFRGNDLEKWQISRPDGTQLQQGNGDLPSSFQLASSLSKYLKPGHVTRRWSVISGEGTVLESGQGDIPASLLKSLPTSAITVAKSMRNDGSASFWEVKRPSGIKVLQGQGSLPEGIISTIKGDLFLPKAYTVTKWSVRLPNGTLRTGTGQIPQSILDLFPSTMSGPGTSAGASSNRNWRVRYTNGTLFTPQQGQMQGQGQWEATLSNGSRTTGSGPVPFDLAAFTGSQPSGNGAGQPRMRRAAASSFNPVMDIISNCGETSATPPSIHVFASKQVLTFYLKTSLTRRGVMFSTPVHEGTNDVTMIYDGSRVTAIVNGAAKFISLAGRIESSGGPITIGRCGYRPRNRFHGEIEMIEMFGCLP